MWKAVNEGNGPLPLSFKGPRLWPSAHFYNQRPVGAAIATNVPGSTSSSVSIKIRVSTGIQKVLLPSGVFFLNKHCSSLLSAGRKFAFVLSAACID